MSFFYSFRTMSSSPDRCPLCNSISSHVYVGNLKEDVTNAELKKIFDVYGPIKKTWIARNPKSRGFGFVSFFNYSDSKRAVEDMDGRNVFGSYIKVEISRNRSMDEWYDRKPTIPPLLGELSSPPSNRHSPTSALRSGSRSPRRHHSSAHRYRSRSPPHLGRHKSRGYKSERFESPSPLFDTDEFYDRRRSSSPLPRHDSREQIYSYRATTQEGPSDFQPFQPNEMTQTYPPTNMMGYTQVVALKPNSTEMTNMVPLMPDSNSFQPQFTQLPSNYDEPKQENNFIMSYQNFGVMPPQVQNPCLRPQMTYTSQFPIISSTPAPQLSAPRVLSAVPPPRCPLPIEKPKVPPTRLPLLPPPPPLQPREYFAPTTASFLSTTTPTAVTTTTTPFGSTTAPVFIGTSTFNPTSHSQIDHSSTNRPI